MKPEAPFVTAHTILPDIIDEEMILSTIKQALTEFGWNIETATDGEEEIQKFHNGNFDLVITDMKMQAEIESEKVIQ